MQTFLPYNCFYESAKALDYRRLGKQRVEAMQLVNSTNKLLQDPNAKVGWANHPARTMWMGYLDALKHYHNIMVEEWINRGFKNTMKFYETPSSIVLPHWLGDERIHASHRSNLIRKDPAYYSQFNWAESADIPYHWPV
jgi:hypothetical protein